MKHELDQTILQRNSIKDATHVEEGSGFKFLLLKHTRHMWCGANWCITAREFSDLTPIQKTQTALVTEMSEVKEYLDPDENYSYHKVPVIAQGSGWIEIPDGAEFLIKMGTGLRVGDQFFFKHDGEDLILYRNTEWIHASYDCAQDYIDEGDELLWSREPIQKPQPEIIEGLISGADALRAVADGKDVEFLHDSQGWVSCLGLNIDQAIGGLFKLRLKPSTILINGIEVPAPTTEQKTGDDVWFISSVQAGGYNKVVHSGDCDYLLGVWDSEEKIKVVVDALRKVLGVQS